MLTGVLKRARWLFDEVRQAARSEPRSDLRRLEPLPGLEAPRAPGLDGAAHLALSVSFWAAITGATLLWGYIGISKIVSSFQASAPDWVGAVLLVLCGVALVIGHVGAYYWQRRVTYGRQRWLGVVADLVATHFDVRWSKINEVTRYLPLARPMWFLAKDREFRLLSRDAWGKQTEDFVIVVPMERDGPIAVYATGEISRQSSAETKAGELSQSANAVGGVQLQDAPHDDHGEIAAIVQTATH